MERDNRCYPADCLRRKKIGRIVLLSCNGATPNSKGRSAAEMFSKKTYGGPVTAAYNASVNYGEGTGNPSLGPGINLNNGIFTNISHFLRFLTSDWVTMEYR